PLKADGKRSIFRVHRDVRFAKDKSPYKTHCGAVMTRSGAKSDHGLLYIHIDPEGCFAVAGFYAPASPDLLKIRQAIAGTRGAYKRVETGLGKGRLSLSDANQLTRVPRGFEELKGGKLDHAIRLKSFIVREELSASAITSADLVATISDFAGRAMPLLRFGWKALD
ncbi:MAG: TIGR02453 family protein, partial [Boseongicola sp.]